MTGMTVQGMLEGSPWNVPFGEPELTGTSRQLKQRLRSVSQELLDLVTQLEQAVPHAQAMVRYKFGIDEMPTRTEDVLEKMSGDGATWS